MNDRHIGYSDVALRIACEGSEMVGIASIPAACTERGVLVVVGGPQYRAGSHRQFTLLARSLALQGIATLRFDYRGMGDSEGKARDFEGVDNDIRAAIDAFFAAVPQLREVVIWGLCDAASAAMFYARCDPRVCGLVLLNPWARTDAGLAKATLKHYYRDRLFDPALWKKIASGKFAAGAAAASFIRQLRAAFAPSIPATDKTAADRTLALPERMLAGLAGFSGKVLLIVCPADLTAQEFIEMSKASPDWQRLLNGPRVQRQVLEGADHTFSRREWRDTVAQWTAQWVQAC